jgi:hypothetical protein
MAADVTDRNRASTLVLGRHMPIGQGPALGRGIPPVRTRPAPSLPATGLPH